MAGGNGYFDGCQSTLEATVKADAMCGGKLKDELCNAVYATSPSVLPDFEEGGNGNGEPAAGTCFSQPSRVFGG